MKTDTTPLGNKIEKRLSPLPEDMKALYLRAALLEITYSMKSKLDEQKSKIDETAFLKREKMIMDMIAISEEFVRLTRSNALHLKQMTSLSMLASSKTYENDKLKAKIIELEKELETIKSEI